MKKLLAVIFFLTLPLFVAAPALAKNQMFSQKVVTLPAGETVDTNYFAAGEIVEIDGIVNGDAYVAGGQVNVSGTINGDLLVAGGTVNISGTISQDVRVAGGQVSLNGKVGGNVTAAAGNLDITEQAQVGKGLVLASGNARINSQVGADIFAGGNLRLSSQANIDGDVFYWSQEEISLDPSAKVGGEISKQQIKTQDLDLAQADKGFKSAMKGLAVFAKLTSVTTTLILGALLLYFFPNHAQKAASVVSEKTLKSLGTGFIALILLPVVALALFMTIVGIPLALLFIALAFFYVFLARIYIMVTFGNKALKLAGTKQAKIGWVFLLGLTIYYLLTFLPIIGGLIKFFIMPIAVGAALLNDVHAYQGRK
jgi:cytoskeletal protein CcmA (bactofilin family)